MVKGSLKKALLTNMVVRMETPAILAAKDLRKSMAAQALGLVPNRSHSTACSMKGKLTMRRIKGKGVGKHTKERCPRCRELVGGQLLPGIPDEITLALIIPKLSWRVSHVLSSVSRCWEDAIRSRQVYEARVSANATETLIIHVHGLGPTIALYSTREKRCYEVPPLPVGLIDFCGAVAVDGKIYVLGGYRSLRGGPVLEGELARDQLLVNGNVSLGEVYMLDLARGQGKWEQCASMPESKTGFGCGIIEDKIYVFGGRNTTTQASVLRSEVYDTQKNAWSPIRPISRSLAGTGVASVATVGKRLVLYGTDAPSLGVYDPTKNKWGLLKRFWEEPGVSTQVFVAKGKFYSLSPSGIDVYDVKENSWTNLHTNSFATVRPDDSARLRIRSISAVADELFLTAGWYGGFFRQSIQCKGFDGDKKELVWHETDCSSLSIDRRCFLLERSIEL